MIKAIVTGNLFYRWRPAGFVYGPSVFKTISEASSRDSEFLGNLDKQYELPFVVKVGVLSLVSVLLFCGSPSAIRRLVIPVGIGVSVERVPFAGTLAHVFNESGESIPPLADRNASTTVFWVGFAFFVEASLSHGGPRIVLRSMSLPVSFAATYFGFSLPASATIGPSCNKVVSVNCLGLSAHAPTEPEVLLAVGMRESQGGQFSERLSSQILHGTHMRTPK